MDPFLDQSQDHGGLRMPTLKEGMRLFNRRYELVRPLGAGGMGVVWLARDHTEHADVAMKFLPTVLALQESEMQSLREEVRAGKGLRHANIVATYGLEVEDGTAAIIMEYVTGSTLKDLLLAQPRGFFEPNEISTWARNISDALDYLHSKARRIHRDIKPANIIVDAQGEARLMDFGISQRIHESVSLHSKVSANPGSSSSTLAYASPQQLSGKLAHHTDDLYSLGATLYDLLTGTPPFYRGGAEAVALQIKTEPVTPIMERRAELVTEGKNAGVGQPVPAAVEEVILACLSKEREARPTNAQSAFTAATQPTVSPPPPRPPSSGNSANPFPALVVIVVLAVAGLKPWNYFAPQPSGLSLDRETWHSTAPLSGTLTPVSGDHIWKGVAPPPGMISTGVHVAPDADAPTGPADLSNVAKWSEFRARMAEEAGKSSSPALPENPNMDMDLKDPKVLFQFATPAAAHPLDKKDDDAQPTKPAEAAPQATRSYRLPPPSTLFKLEDLQLEKTPPDPGTARPEENPKLKALELREVK